MENGTENTCVSQSLPARKPLFLLSETLPTLASFSVVTLIPVLCEDTVAVANQQGGPRRYMPLCDILVCDGQAQRHAPKPLLVLSPTSERTYAVPPQLVRTMQEFSTW